MATPLADESLGLRLRVTEIFYSLQGEANTVGYPTVFIRLTGCPLRCTYCDTEYAFKGGEWLELGNILDQIAQFSSRFVTVTGGEPLAQRETLTLLSRLCDNGYRVSLETSGALDISAVDRRVHVVMDLKTPSSHEVQKNRFENLEHLKADDEIKFVIADRTDYDWARARMLEYDLVDRVQILFSPAYGQVEPSLLADWILEDALPVRFQLQLHKLLWGDARGR